MAGHLPLLEFPAAIIVQARTETTLSKGNTVRAVKKGRVIACTNVLHAVLCSFVKRGQVYVSVVAKASSI